MRVTMLAVGSRGDVDPLLAFGAALSGTGHEVKVAAFEKYARRVEDAGLDFAPLAEGEVSKGLQSSEGRRWLERGSRRLPTAVALVKDARSVARRRMSDAMDACEHSEALVTSELGLLLGWQISRRSGAPLVRVRLSPPGRFPQGPAAGALRQGAWLAARPWLHSVSRDAGLPRLPLREPLGSLGADGTLELCAYSPSAMPPPPGAGPRTRVTGFWFQENSHDPNPPAGLAEFIAEGEPPVCLGFGSMGTADPGEMTRLSVEALAGAGRRGVLVGDHHHRDLEIAPGMSAVQAVDFGWLLPQCAAVVHHGGAGTTAAALRAGIPSVTVPHMLDQFTWGRRLSVLGAAPPPIPRRKLTMQRLREGIAEAVGDSGFTRRAADLGRAISHEDGVANALEAFELHIGAGERRLSTITHG